MVQTDTVDEASSGQTSFWQEHSLTIMILTGMLVAALVFWFTGLEYWQAQQRAHGESQRIWPDFVVYYVADMTDSLFGSLVGALTIVMGTKYLRERGRNPSSQDKDSQ